MARNLLKVVEDQLDADYIHHIEVPPGHSLVELSSGSKSRVLKGGERAAEREEKEKSDASWHPLLIKWFKDNYPQINSSELFKDPTDLQVISATGEITETLERYCFKSVYVAMFLEAMGILQLPD